MQEGPEPLYDLQQLAAIAPFTERQLRYIESRDRRRARAPVVARQRDAFDALRAIVGGLTLTADGSSCSGIEEERRRRLRPLECEHLRERVGKGVERLVADRPSRQLSSTKRQDRRLVGRARGRRSCASRTARSTSSGSRGP